jgi:branched-chain amino acid transport system substrate-binding protein
MRKLSYAFLSLMIFASIILTACQPAATDTPAPEVVPTEAPEPTEVMEEEPTEEPMDEGPMVRHCADGLEGETIYFYSQAGLTGPLASILGTSFVNALNDSIAEVNATGGVCGATVDLILTDTQYDPEQEIATYQIHRNDTPPPVAIATYGSGASIALAPMVNEDKVANFAAGLNAQAFYVPRNGYTLGVAPIYSDQFAGFIDFLVANWADIKPEGAGDDIVIGVMGWEGPFGAGATTTESLAYAESQGVTVLELETYAISAEADLVSPLQSLAVQGANVIYNQALGFGTAQMIGTLRALEMWDSVVVGGNVWSMNTDVLTILGENAAGMNGYYGVFPWHWWTDTDVEGVQMATEAFNAGGYPESERGISYLTSYAGTFAWRDILVHAIDMFGYENLNGDTFFQAFQDLGLVSALGVFEYDVRGESRSPHMAQIRQAQAGADGVQFVVVQDFFELPDTRPSE